VHGRGGLTAGVAPPPWLRQLERALESDGEDALVHGLVVLTGVAGDGVALGEDEVRGAGRRALLLLATGGDPRRGLDLRGRAVSALAAELDAPSRRNDLAAGLVAVREQAGGLAHVGELLRQLETDPDTAWRAFCAGRLALALEED
jgi:hypothetical protein